MKLTAGAIAAGFGFSNDSQQIAPYGCFNATVDEGQTIDSESFMDIPLTFS